MTQPRVVILAPGAVSDLARHHLAAAIEHWQATPGKALVLDEGMQLGITGGLTVGIWLKDGPLAGIRIGLHLATLDDLPQSLTYDGGEYRRWLSVDGAQMVSTDGEPCYLWEPAP